MVIKNILNLFNLLRKISRVFASLPIVINIRLQEKFGCMSPFIPRKYRSGIGLCRNQTTANILNTFLSRSVALTGNSANLWSSDYYFMPPCTTFKYHIDELNQHIRCTFQLVSKSQGIQPLLHIFSFFSLYPCPVCLNVYVLLKHIVFAGMAGIICT